MFSSMIRLKTIGMFIQVFAVLTALLSLWALETERSEIPRQTISTSSGPATVYGEQDGPIVLVAHGFAGSSQMMQVILYDLVRAGVRPVSFDFAGHGRSSHLMSRDVARIEGTTQQLVDQTLAVAQTMRAKTGKDMPIAFVGHSMATDVVIRAARQLDDTAAIVAISMYSDAIGPDHPDGLLIISGEWEDRLREIALGAVRQVDANAIEGQTARSERVLRKAVAAPKVGHVGVIYSATTLQETREWVAAAFEIERPSETRSNAWAILSILVSFVVLSGLIARLLPKQVRLATPLNLSQFFIVLTVPIAPALGAAYAFGGPLLGIAAFGYLLIFYFVWGALSLGLLARYGRKPHVPNILGLAVLFALCVVFAFALDRYAASFLPIGQRFGLMMILLIGTLPFMLADALIAEKASLWRRVLIRIAPLSALFGLLWLTPQDFGLLFTVLPVMILFYLVFGTMGRFVTWRVGASTSGIVLGVMLAWSIAASQPLFVAVM